MKGRTLAKGAGEYSVEEGGGTYKKDTESCVMRSLVISTRHQTRLGLSVKEVEMGGAYDRYGGEQKCTYSFGWKPQREEIA
jgi:hypothetical protein